MENKIKKTWSDFNAAERDIEIHRLIASRNFGVLRMVFERVIASTDPSVYDWFDNHVDAIIQSTDDNLNPIINRANE